MLSTSHRLHGGAWKGLALLLLLAAAVFVGSLLVGSAELSPVRVLAALLGSGDSIARSVTLAVRLPRTLAAFGVGSLLALADPFVLGVSGGAAVGALLAMMAGAAMFVIQGSAVAGAVVAVVIVHLLARSGGTTRLLLTGVVLASACGAFVTVLLSVADASSLRGMVFWLAGDLEWAVDPLASALTAVLAVALAVLLARPLNVLAAGELRARTVGMNLQAWRSLVFVGCAGLTAVAVVSAGTVGFVGLVTPHLVRLAFRTSDHRVVAPASALLGGTLLACADVVARTAVAPRQLPVGAIMALVGAPLFIALLRRRG
jgi:iron complex transport system permease protein